MKRYTFLDEDERVMQVVRAEDYYAALKVVNGYMSEDDKDYVTSDTDFYSEEIDEEEF